MVFLNGVKYACATCIKGHRSSQCQHSERPLFEIKKKGRPITQCSHCRELRKTKQVHVKCMCSEKIKKEDGIGLHHRHSPPNGSSESPEPILANAHSCENMSGVEQTQDAHHNICTCDIETNKVKLEPNAHLSYQRAEALLTPPLESHGQCCGSPNASFQSKSTSLPSPPTLHGSTSFTTSNSNPADGGPYHPPLIAPRPIYHQTYPLNLGPSFHNPNNGPTNNGLQYPPKLTQRNATTASELSLPPPSAINASSSTSDDQGKVIVHPPPHVYDPTDDMDSDTPTYTSDEVSDHQRDQTAVFGELSHTSSEDLLNIIYRGFPRSTSNSNEGVTNTNGNSSSSVVNGSCCNGAVREQPPGHRGEVTRIVTCRCGDSCACLGCLVHPDKVMMSEGDPYAGYNGKSNLEMEGIRCCSNSPAETTPHTVYTDEDGVMMCGCGCNKPDEQCKDCFRDLCEGTVRRRYVE
ncbi:hypothetical protein BC938DRAFT_477181 [Jimgerdemannia flammicorona]|uniref:Copper-fist domain-containing protein n=1 Tax=Jimgerdemannia flammicorona TaxID=994334 RepID=A0A433PBD4_9FUNG|nr:hypothetical protein BC938DRAFT_477181 [Jimgerdemannia flammicorona]